MTLRKALLGSVVLWACGGAAGQAVAAGANDAVGESAGQAQVGEVLVTARKREESLQSIPVAVTAQTAQQLQQQGIREPTDLSRIVPSLTIVSSASSPTGAITSLRGQAAADVLLTLSQPVGFYEDSVNIPHPEGTNVSFFDLSRVEVLNGPQGTLYGRNTTGGAINIITRNADYNGIHGNIYLEGGNFHDFKGSGAVNMPLINDVFSVRLAYQYWKRNGFGRSAVTGERFGSDRNDNIFRASFKFDPAPNFTAIAKVEYVNADRNDAMYQTVALGGSHGTVGQLIGAAGGAHFCSLLGLPLLNLPGSVSAASSCATADFEWALEGAPGGVPPSGQVANTPDMFTNYSERATFENLKAWHSVLDATWRISDDISLRSITGYHQFTDFRTFDLDALRVQLNSVGSGANGIAAAVGSDLRPLRPDEESRQITQELDLNGHAFDSRLNWLVGAFYSDDLGTSEQRALALPGLLNSVTDFYNPRVTNRSWALFTQNDFKLNDMFSVTAGGRYTEETVGQTKSVYNYSLNAANPLRFTCTQGPNATVPPTSFASEGSCAFSESLKSTGWSYLFSFNAQVTHDILLYAKTARGFRGGALQIRSAGGPVRPETATDYELGLKSEWFDRRVRVNLALYQTNYSNKQETKVVIVNNAPLTQIVNAANARIRGIEGQFAAVPFKGLTLNATFDYLQGVYTRYPNALGPDGHIIASASGDSFNNRPWQVDLGARYEHDLGPGSVAIQGDYAWTSRVTQNELNIDPLEPVALRNRLNASFGIVNARLEYNLRDKGLTLAVFATNLLDKHYQVAGVSGLPGFYLGNTMEPRMWGISVRKTFGAE